MDKHIAETNKVWKRKGSENVLSEILILGKEDSLDNYIQVEKEIENLEG